MFSNRSFAPQYTHGTQRLIHPDQTLDCIIPHLKTCGITRCTEITQLDVDLGVPTYCAIRPAALVLQTSSGKGLTRLSAQVSALMEAIELHHAENPLQERLWRSSQKALTQQGLSVISPNDLKAEREQFYSDDYTIEWVTGEELISKQQIWVPASSAYFCLPAVNRTSTNGLASGNHILEAILHALFELIERDAISNIDVHGRLAIKEKCKIIDLTTIADNRLQQIVHKIEAGQSKLVLLWAPSCIRIHTFWAVLLNRISYSAVSTFNVGYGTHFDINIAAARAITEAVQSRLTLVHNTREDIIAKPVYKASYTQASLAYAYFDHLQPDTAWETLVAFVDYRGHDLLQEYHYLLTQLVEAGHKRIFFIDLTDPKINIPVVKILIPSFQLKRGFF